MGFTLKISKEITKFMETLVYIDNKKNIATTVFRK